MFTLPNGTEIPEEDVPIWSAHNNRCVAHPNLYAVCLHEEPPKSKNPNWKQEPWTRFPVCAYCHERVHEMPRIEAQSYLEFERAKNFPMALRLLVNHG